MGVVDILNKKRLGKELSYQELDFIFNGYLNGTVKDYQMSALLMAICINGMSDDEIFALTKIFIDSGDILSFDDAGIIVDKHSTGGIGDKTTLVIAPIVASCGVPVVKMSGRGLGYTGGTIDKLESIPGFNVNLTDEKVKNQLKKIGVSISSQTANLTPIDKVIYALRDVTATVSSIPLVASSIMSKKIAGGADKILIDIKVGKGALLKNREEAKKLADLMVKIGGFYQKEVRIVISDMNTPLGYCTGNSLEVLEAIEILKGRQYGTVLSDLCIDLASDMVSMGKEISKQDAKIMVLESLNKGRAYEKFLELVKAQGGHLDKMKVSKKTQRIKASIDGVIKNIDALAVGKLSIELGAGRKTKEDKVDHTVGIRLNKLIGDKVKKGDVLATLYVNDEVDLDNIETIFTIGE